MTEQYNWFFGDFTTASGITVYKSFDIPGFFPVILTKTNEWSSTQSIPQFINVLSYLQDGDVLPDFTESTIYGTLTPGQYEVGLHPIVGANYQYSTVDNLFINRFYFELDETIGACGGTVYCNAALETPHLPRGFYDTKNREPHNPSCSTLPICCRGITFGFGPGGFFSAFTPCLTDGPDGPLISSAAECEAYVNANNTTLLPGYTAVPNFIGPPDILNHFFMVSIADKYKALLRSPLLNRPGIVETFKPRVNLGTGFFDLINITSTEIKTYKNFFDSLVGEVLYVHQVNFNTCPDYSPVGTTLAAYKVTGYQRNHDDRVLIKPQHKMNGDQLLAYGKFICHTPTVYIQPDEESDTVSLYANQGEIDGHNFANMYEYSNQFLYANKQNGLHLGRFVRVLERETTAYPPFAQWHETVSPPRGLANKLFSKDPITVKNPIDDVESESYAVTTHDVSGLLGYQSPVEGNENSYTVKFVSLDLKNSTEYVKERAFAYFNKFQEKLNQKNLRLNAFFTNITTEEENQYPDLTTNIITTMPFVNDNVRYQGHSANDVGLHFSINPFQENTAPLNPQPGFTSTNININPNYYTNYLKTGAYIINPRNKYLKNWLLSHANGTESQKNAVNFLFTYSYAQEVTASNIQEYINKDFGIFVRDGVNSFMDPEKNVYTGFTSFGLIGFDEQYYYGKIALDKLGSNLYKQIHNAFSPSEGVEGLSLCNLLNYVSFVCAPKGRTGGVTGSFEYSDSIYIDTFNRPYLTHRDDSDVDIMAWYSTVPDTNLAWVMAGSYISRTLSERFKINNYIKYPYPNFKLTPTAGLTLNGGTGIYDMLAHKTLPFWIIVKDVNNMRALWRNQPDRKKCIWLTNLLETQTSIRTKFYRPEYNIHGILMSSDDVMIPLFSADQGNSAYENSVLNAMREVNKVIQHNRKRLIYTQDPYSFNYMSPTYLNASLDGKTYTNLLHVPPLATCVEFGGDDGTSNYPYIACRVTLPLPNNYTNNIPGEGVDNGYKSNTRSFGIVDFGATLTAAETYPNLPPPFRVGVSFGDRTEAIYQPGLSRPSGLWILGENNYKFRNMNFKLILGACGATGICCSGTGGDCFGFTTIDNCSVANGFFIRGKTSCVSCSIQGILPSFEIEGES